MRKRAPSRLGLTALFSFIVFIILLITALIMGVVVVIAVQSGLVDQITHGGPLFPVLMLILVSVIVGTVVSAIASRVPLRPIRKLISLINQLASGDFSVRMEKKRQAPPEMRELADSFNRMAEELSNTELLRSDFVDNFSHELKTPMVSIKGFAEMLRFGDISEQERNEYLDVIISESARLSSLATNILNLSKIEKQVILTDVKSYNVGEQIRGSIILLQSKWETKNQNISFEGTDVAVIANEEMLGQVWINLIDNAIKYSPNGASVKINTDIQNSEFVFTIHNGGEPIKEEAMPRIFDKFYQGDVSHASAGNGLGLALVKRVVELHNGNVSCESNETGTVFLVRLPVSAVNTNEICG